MRSKQNESFCQLDKRQTTNDFEVKCNNKTDEKKGFDFAYALYNWETKIFVPISKYQQLFVAKKKKRQSAHSYFRHNRSDCNQNSVLKM